MVEGISRRSSNDRVTATIKFIRAHKGPVFKDDVIEWAFQENTRLGGKPIARETLSSGWYYKFLARNKLGTSGREALGDGSREVGHAAEPHGVLQGLGGRSRQGGRG
jgi:hypothetical protein